MTQTSPRYIVGIDLGTTHTVVAYADTAEMAHGDARPHIHPFPLDQLVAPGEVAPRPMLPSVRYHPAEGELPADATALPWVDDEQQQPSPPVLGQLALDLGAKVPGRLVTSAKSWLSHAGVDRTEAILPWGAAGDVPKISPVDASASYLRHVRHDWNHRTPDHPLEDQDVVLTVPASFDEAARALTMHAAKRAGLPHVRLVEEPQSAFYDWLDRHRDDLEQRLADLSLAIVVDVGGGTSDLTLIRVELREPSRTEADTRDGDALDEEEPVDKRTGARIRLTRIAVGEHLMLGGDNMDLALARRIEERIAQGKPLGAARFSQLVHQCRIAKEALLAPDAPASTRVTVLGSGAQLVGGSLSAEITRDEVHELVLDGFFPEVDADARPSKRRGGLVEFGLPYASDPAVTRHLAEFLTRHDERAREALGARAPSPDAPAVPDAVLFNGGVYRGSALADRTIEVLGSWRGEAPQVLDNDDPDLAVARGAVAYGLARRGAGVRIGGGSARSYFLVVDKGQDGTKQGVCVLPHGAEEGEEIELKSRTFSLRTGRPVRFHLVSSTSEVQSVRPGDVVELTDGERYHDLPPIAAVLEDTRGGEAGPQRDGGRDIPVHLITSLTEVGTLDLSCVDASEPSRRWKLEFQIRGWEQGSDTTAARVTQLHPRFNQASERIKRVYGRSAKDVHPREIKQLRADLEKLLGSRDSWETPLLRELFAALWTGVKRRRRSKDHERIWFNLVGYTLRPGFGYPLDEWRIKQLTSIYDQEVQFAPETQNWAEWWIMWRRVAGGLDASMQQRILDDIAWYLEPPSPRPKKRPPGPKKLGYDDMVRLAGSLEQLAPGRKAQLGGWLVERLTQHGEKPHTWWSVGRVGARVPFYGSAHNVVPPHVAAEWLQHALALDWKKVEHAPFAAMLLSRASGDRERDLEPELREQVAQRLETVAAPSSWVQMVREVTRLEAADQQRIFGESLPPGLRLID